MANNISKYVQLNDFLLLEYEFNKSGDLTDLTSESIYSIAAETVLGSKEYFNRGSMGSLNNDLQMNSVPRTANRSSWYIDPENPAGYYPYFDSSALIAQPSYPFDTVKVHIVSGYNFDDIPGFLLQIQAEDASGGYVDLSNFTWINQSLPGYNVIKFATNNLYLANKSCSSREIFRVSQYNKK